MNLADKFDQWVVFASIGGMIITLILGFLIGIRHRKQQAIKLPYKQVGAFMLFMSGVSALTTVMLAASWGLALEIIKAEGYTPEFILFAGLFKVVFEFYVGWKLITQEEA